MGRGFKEKERETLSEAINSKIKKNNKNHISGSFLTFEKQKQKTAHKIQTQQVLWKRARERRTPQHLCALAQAEPLHKGMNCQKRHPALLRIHFGVNFQLLSPPSLLPLPPHIKKVDLQKKSLERAQNGPRYIPTETAVVWTGAPLDRHILRCGWFQFLLPVPGRGTSCEGEQEGAGRWGRTPSRIHRTASEGL